MSTPEETRPGDRINLGKDSANGARPDVPPSAPENAAEQSAEKSAEGDKEVLKTEEPIIELVQLVEEGDASNAPATLADGSGGSLPPAASDGTLPAEPGDDEEDDEEEEEAGDGEGGRMSLMDHLRELRQRILYSLGFVFVGFLLCWAFVEPVFDVLTRPMLDALPKGGTAMYTTLPEAFFTRMYIAFFLGLFVASPFVFYQIWAFISPGLYEEEKHFILPVALVSAVFFIAGGLFCYHVVFTYAFNFFMGFVTEDIQAMPKISEYLEFVLKMLLAFGLIFEMPIFAFFLSRMGVISAKGMRGVRRYAILVIFIVAAILTPPDVVSQLLMAAPMLILYEVSILVAAIFGKKPNEEPAKEEDEDEDEDDEEDDEDWDEDEEDEDEEEDEDDRNKSDLPDVPEYTTIPGAGAEYVDGQWRAPIGSSAYEGAMPRGPEDRREPAADMKNADSQENAGQAKDGQGAAPEASAAGDGGQHDGSPRDGSAKAPAGEDAVPEDDVYLNDPGQVPDTTQSWPRRTSRYTYKETPQESDGTAPQPFPEEPAAEGNARGGSPQDGVQDKAESGADPKAAGTAPQKGENA